MIKTIKYFNLIVFSIIFIAILSYKNIAFADQFDSYFDEASFVEGTYSSDITPQTYPENNYNEILVSPEGNDIFDAAINSYHKIDQKEVELALAKTKTENQQQKYNAQVSWDVDAGLIHSKATDNTLSKTKTITDIAVKTSLTLNKTLWDKALGYSIEASKQDIQTARINQFSDQQKLIESVALAYLEYLAAKDMEAIAKRRVNLFSQLSIQIVRKERLGFAANIDVVEVEKQLQTAEISLLRAQSNLQNTQINLTQLTDSEIQATKNNSSYFHREDDIRLLPVSQLIDIALNNNIDLQSLQSEQISFQKIIQSRRADASTKLNLVSSLSQAWKHGDSDQEKLDFSVGINMKMPLYTGGRINNQVKQAKLNLLRMERGTNKKRREIITQLNILASEFSGALSSYQSLLRLRKNLTKNVRLIKAAVPYGVRGNHNVYSALDDQFQLENSLIKQYYDLLKIKVKVMKITGSLDSKNLNQLRGLLLSNNKIFP